MIEDTRAFVPAIALRRTEAERRDELLSWDRPDPAFFAAGACHVLAFRFLDRHPDAGYEAIHIRPCDGLLGNHVYVTDGVWALDFNGWTPEETLLDETIKACRELWPTWRFDRIVLRGSIEDFCASGQFRLPHQYASDAAVRADRYLDTLPDGPPHH